MLPEIITILDLKPGDVVLIPAPEDKRASIIVTVSTIFHDGELPTEDALEDVRHYGGASLKLMEMPDYPYKPADLKEIIRVGRAGWGSKVILLSEALELGMSKEILTRFNEAQKASI